MPTDPRHPANAKAAIITGASSGLGRELAKQFSAGGNQVILSGRNVDELRITHAECMNATPVGKKYCGAVRIAGDLCNPAIVQKIRDTAHLLNAEYLISCAAVYSSGPTDKSEPCDVLLPNLIATIELVKAIYSMFAERKYGTIININSSAGKKGTEQEALYAASKHGLTGFFSSLRLEARRKNVRVMDVFIGGMKTPMMRHRSDWPHLIDPVEAAEIIYKVAGTDSDTLQVDELTLGRFCFPL